MCCRFMITQFITVRLIRLMARIPLKIGDDPSAFALHLCVNFHKRVSVAF